MTMDYRKTLNLPKTNFSMRAGLVNKEPQYLARWEEEELYTKIRNKAKGQKPFILHDGPPYANGDIHMGHALNKILKDVIVKMKTMQGRDSHYVPGWDCHGLPIEHQLFKKLKKRKSDVEPVSFRKEAHDFALKYVDIQREQFQRLGIFGDWMNPYLTLNPDYEYWILHSLAQLNQEGYIYRGLKPVNWCSNCETALAEAEVEYEDHASPSIYVRFQINNPEALPQLPKDRASSLLIWTTTPWTLFANVAVAVQAGFDYVLMDDGREVVIVEESLKDTVLVKQAGGAKEWKQIGKVRGSELTNLTYNHPLGVQTNCVVVTTDYVTKEDGTGLVHTAPGHGQDDFEAGKIYGLDVLVPVDHRGVYTEDAGEFAGTHVFKANDAIIEKLHQQGILFNEPGEKLPHSYPHCWRCKKPVIFRATKQWFMSIDHKDLRKRLKETINSKVEWIPASGQERILGMVSGRPDWCLSRQRYWGVPIPALSCQGCNGEHRLYSSVIEKFAGLARREGTDIWFKEEVPAFLPEGFSCPDCGGESFEKTYDILDVWFDSGVSHQAVAGPMMGTEIPVDLYLEGSDQHRGWFQSSIIPAVALHETAPYKQVLTHGFVVDGGGRKMSKSMGNVISPLDEIKTKGADILRLWVASSSYNEDIRLSKEIMDRQVDAYRKIRNTFRYLLGNLHGFDPQRDCVSVKDMPELDRWAMDRLSSVVTGVREAYNRYEFVKVTKRIYSFCNEDLSGFYLDILKDRLYTSHAFSQERRCAQTVLYYICQHLVMMLAPVLSFTADEVFLEMPKDSSMADISCVHLLEWPEIPQEWSNPGLREDLDRVTELRPAVMKALEDFRGKGGIGSSLEARMTFLSADEQQFEYLKKRETLWPSVFIVSHVDVEKTDAVEAGLSPAFSATTVEINQAEGLKCDRCWNILPSVGMDDNHPALCRRCTEVVKRLLEEPVNS